MASIKLENGIADSKGNYIVFENGTKTLVMKASDSIDRLVQLKYFSRKHGMIIYSATCSGSGDEIEQIFNIRHGLYMLGLLSRRNEYYGGLKLDDISIIKS